MPRSVISLPDDRELRRIFLLGMTSAHKGWDDEDVANARPILAPGSDAFDHGRRVGLDMATKNVGRKRGLQQGIVGRAWRVLFGRKAAKDRRDSIPDIPT